MRASNERLTILSEAEQSALYELPDFDDDQRLEYLMLTDEEQALALNRPRLSAQLYCLLQIGYFKAKKIFFRFVWEEVDEDIKFVLQQYFPEHCIFDRQIITKHEHYTQCNMIALHFNYLPWSKSFEQLIHQQASKIIFRDINPQFVG